MDAAGERQRPALAEVVAVLDRWYPPRTAERWDAVGLAVGDPAADVDTVLLAVDPVGPVVEQAITLGAQLLVTHHPLLLSGVTHLPRSSPKGRVVHDLIASGVALYNAHTNADIAVGGVNDALAEVVGLVDARPLEPAHRDPLDQLVVFVPTVGAEALLDALAAAGAGELGDYRRAAFRSDGFGTFEPQPGAHPTVGSIGSRTEVAETRLEIALPRARRDAVIAALRNAHPYEEPAFALVEHAPEPATAGLGRIGRLVAPSVLSDFTEHVARVLPGTTWGVRAAGDPTRRVETVAVCGGSGASEIATAEAAGADVLVTSDLKHHVASEATTERGPGAMALIDAAHWATEWPWLPVLADRLRHWSNGALTVHVSEVVTDPWTLHCASQPQEVARP